MVLMIAEVKKNKQILKAVAETEYIPLQTKVKSSSISSNDAKNHVLRMNEKFLVRLHIGWVTTLLLMWKKAQISPSSHWGSWELFCKCQSLVILKACFSKSSSNIGLEQHTVISWSLCVQGVLWTVVKRKSID